ncbi:rhomboid family protein [Nitzschia inconspicua]|uniref:rhomboid protease n=1 Tax=Nitzschia inconspicua TaxID=303405 RepID=A0A9K3LNL4_9STRA|nr:rhomboid family protein [Nitzschia inconspicua]
MSSYNKNIKDADYIQPWWLGGNDDDLHKTAYEDDLPADADDDALISTTSSMAVVETTNKRFDRSTGYQNSHERGHTINSIVEEEKYCDHMDQPLSSSQYQIKSVRRDKKVRGGEAIKTSSKPKLSLEENASSNATSQKPHSPSLPADSRTSNSSSSRTDEQRQSKSLAQSSSSSPTREKLRAWTETGKSKLRHAVDKIKSTNVLPANKNGSKTIRWTCKACTYLNVRERLSISTHPSSSHLACEICGTPNEGESRISHQRSFLAATVYQDDNPCDPSDVVDLTLTDERENNMATGSATIKRESSVVILPFMSAFQRLFFQKRQNSATSAETCPAGASDDFEQTRQQNGLDNRSEAASSSLESGRVYSVAELVASLGAVDGDVDLPPALERRVRDFKFAQNKRRERHGDQRPWGIYGLYAHLSDIRADLEWAEDAAWRRQRGQPYLSWRDFDKSRDKGFHNRPWFTYGVLALCTIMMFVTLGVNGWKFEPLNINPLIGPSSETLIKCGARDTNLIVNEAQWYRLFTPMILHAGLVHYVINMLALYFIGGAVEQSHGFASAAVLFIIPAVGGNILSAICLPQYISVGASGGIFGLIGGCVADICLNWNLLFLKTTTDANARLRHFYVLLWLGMDILLNCLLGFTPFVDNFTHLGGFMYGFCCGISTIERLAVGFFGINADKCSRLGSTFMRFFGLIISIIAIMVTTVVLVQSDGVTSPCPGCRYISCIPFPPNAKEKWWYCDDCDVVIADLYQSSGGLYEQINLFCPNGEVEEIQIAGDGIHDKEVLRRALPSYCRAHCDEVFASNQQ